MQTRQPLRIASLLASATEILYGLGLGDRLVAVSHECDYPPDAAGKPRVTRTLIDADAPSLEIDRQVTAMVQQNSALYEIDVPQGAPRPPGARQSYVFEERVVGVDGERRRRNRDRVRPGALDHYPRHRCESPLCRGA